MSNKDKILHLKEKAKRKELKKLVTGRYIKKRKTFIDISKGYNKMRVK